MPIQVTHQLPYTLTLPKKLPLSWNKLYASRSWQFRSRVAEEWHGLIWLEVRAASERLIIQDPQGGLLIRIDAYFPNLRMLDADNICSKLIIDGLVHADVIKADTHTWIKEVTTATHLDRSNPRTEVTIDYA